MPSSSTGRTKPDTRRTILSRRDSLTERERTDRSATICERARAFVEDRAEVGAVIALYAHKGSEVATTILDEALRARGYRIAYPRVVAEARVLVFSEVAIDELVVSRWGLREPSAEVAPVALADIALFVLPGLAFDRQGGRVGWGKGHYDATLAAAGPQAVAIGLAFECQVVERVPRESHDAQLAALITEVTTYVVA